MNVDLGQNKLSAVGVVCGIAGLATMYVALLGIALGIIARRRGEKLWWWALLAGVIGFFGRPQLINALGPLSG